MASKKRKSQISNKKSNSMALKSEKPTASASVGISTPEFQDPFAIDETFIKLNFPQLVETLKRKYVVWGPTEAGWLRMRDEAERMPTLPLRRGVAKVLRKSFAGCFIRYMNKAESTDFDVTEKKFEIIEFMLKLNERPTVNIRLNDFTEDIKKYIHQTVKDSFAKKGWISQKMFIGNLPTLRLCYQKVTEMDASLKRYGNLLALILTANYIRDFAGKILPPNLNMLELYGNVMNDITKLMEHPPPLILYFGVGRNFLSKIATLARLEQFQYLYFLDLSDNNFDSIQEVLDKIVKLTNLKCLSLEGNPCSMPVSYVHIVQRLCPQIEYLDGIRYARDCPSDPKLDDYQGVMQIHGIRFFHVPKPSAKGSKQGEIVSRFYQLEFELPLLDPNLRMFEARALRRLQMGMKEPEEVQPVTRGISSFQKTSISEGPGDRGKMQPEGEPPEKEPTEEEKAIEKMTRSYIRWLMKDKEPPTTTTFMSSKVKWAKVMDFSSPSLEIPVELEMWRLLRDTMRSVVIIRLYYKETMLIKSKKASAKPDKPQGDRRASRRSSKGSRRSSRRQSSKKQSIKRQSMKKGAQRQSMKKGAQRQSMKKGGQRQSMKKGGQRQSMKKGGQRQSMKRGSIKKRLTVGVSSKSKRSTGGQYEEVMLVRNLIAKIPVPAEIPKWNVPFMGYTWDLKERCLAKKYPGIENVKYAGGGSYKGMKRGKSSGGGRKSVTGKRKSRASSGGKRKSRASSGGKRKSQAGGERKSQAGGKRKSQASGKRQSKMAQRKSQMGGKRQSRASKAGGKRQSQASKVGGKRQSQAGKAGGKRQSRASNVGGKRKSMGGQSSKRKRSSARGARAVTVAPPIILTCQVGIGLKRLGKEAPPPEDPKSRKQSRKSKSARKSRASKQSRKSKSGRKSKTANRKSMKRQSVKRASKAGKK